MDIVNNLWKLARALDYARDPDPKHWKTINGSHVHLDGNGNYDGGAGSKFNGRHHYGPGWKEKTSLMNRLASALQAGANKSAQTPSNGGQGTPNNGMVKTEEDAKKKVDEQKKLVDEAYQKWKQAQTDWYNAFNNGTEDITPFMETAKKAGIDLTRAREALEAARKEAASKGVLFISPAWAKVEEAVNVNKVASLPASRLSKKLSEKDIITRLAGGDETEGSCSTLAFAYIANKMGLDVLDFRGGSSQYVFSKVSIIKSIGDLNGIKTEVKDIKKEAAEGAKTLLDLEKGKEYYFAVGRHAAIVKNTDNGPQYLELQSRYPERNGWQPMGNTAKAVAAKLNDRFGAAKSQRRSHGVPLTSSLVLIDSESFKDSKEFEKIVEYFNTNGNKQKKGVHGGVR